MAPPAALPSTKTTASDTRSAQKIGQTQRDRSAVSQRAAISITTTPAEMKISWRPKK
ncbi:hypothetical protein D3C83_91330 [compost metagenome]